MDVNSLLAKFLNKIGVKDYYALTLEEKRSYDALKAALEGKELTSIDVARFWETTIGEIEDKLIAPDLSDKERDFLIVELRLVKKIMSFLNGPDTQKRNARIMVEQQLQE